MLFRNKERPRNEILGFGRARNEMRANFLRGPCSETARKRLLRRLAIFWKIHFFGLIWHYEILPFCFCQQETKRLQQQQHLLFIVHLFNINDQKCITIKI